MGSDLFLTRLEELDEACLKLTERLGGLREAIVEIRSLRLAGRRVSEIAASGPGLPARREVRASWSRVNQALHEYRVQAVKELVDEEGLSIADAARTIGNARQVTSRLYHAGDAGG